MIEFIIKYWLEILFTFISTGFIYIFKQYIGLKKGIQSLLRNEIVRIYELCKYNGYCPSYMKENVSKIYESYHLLKGNGMATSLIEEIYHMKTEDYNEKHNIEII